MSRQAAKADRTRARLAQARAARQDAVTRAERELPAYSAADDDPSEVTARFAAISAEAAANAVGKAWRESQHDAEHEKRAPSSAPPPRVSRFKTHGKIAGALAVGGGGFAALIKFLWHLF